MGKGESPGCVRGAIAAIRASKEGANSPCLRKANICGQGHFLVAPALAISLDGYCRFTAGQKAKLIAGQGFLPLKRCIAKLNCHFARFAAQAIGQDFRFITQPCSLDGCRLQGLAVCGARNVFNPGKKLKMARRVSRFVIFLFPAYARLWKNVQDR